MQNVIAGNAAVPLDGRDEGFYIVASDLVSLIDRVQASIKLIETAESQQVASEMDFADVVVLDDVTPIYAKASAALYACNASLRAALQFMIESTPTTFHA
jgi:hypothetical protein